MQLEAAGIATSDSQMGLEVWCRGLDWSSILESLALALSPIEQRDTRVAMVSLTEDHSSLHRAIFRAKGMDALLRELREGWLSDVLSQGRIVMHLQPLMQFPPGRVHGYECLMRGLDDEGRLIMPARMFQAAATLEKLESLDAICRRTAIAAASRFASSSLTFFINFIPSAVVNPMRTLEQMTQQVEEGGLRPGQIAFEVIETEKVYDQRHLMNVLRHLRKAGFKIALDDVGAGYASLLSLSYLRPDYIKLDGELVRRAANSALEAKMVADLAETARQNGIITVAEGIETEDELRVVLDSGIRLTQGYFHARPQAKPLEDEAVRQVVQRIDGIAAGKA